MQCCQGNEISAAKHTRGRKNCVGKGNSGAELLADLLKKGRNGAEFFFVVWFCTKTVIFLVENFSFPMIYTIFYTVLHCDSL
jgi:hypothetical protein